MLQLGTVMVGDLEPRRLIGPVPCTATLLLGLTTVRRAPAGIFPL